MIRILVFLLGLLLATQAYAVGSWDSPLPGLDQGACATGEGAIKQADGSWDCGSVGGGGVAIPISDTDGDLPDNTILIELGDSSTDDGLISLCDGADCSGLEIGLTTDGSTLRTGLQLSNTDIDFIIGFSYGLLNTQEFRIRQSMGFCNSNSENNTTTKEACIDYDGATDTYILSTDGGTTADVNLEVLGLTTAAKSTFFNDNSLANSGFTFSNQTTVGAYARFSHFTIYADSVDVAEFDGTSSTAEYGLLMKAGFIQGTTTAGITASTTQTQGQGALTAQNNEVSTVANTNDTVTMPTAAAGRRVVIINNGANTLQIFPASGDNLGAGVNTAVTLTSGSNVEYIAYDGTNWEQL